MKTLLLVLFLFATPLFAQKHETLKLNRDSYLTIYNVYDSLTEEDEHFDHYWQKDTLTIGLMVIWGHEVQGKTIKIKTKDADSVSVEQAYYLHFIYADEEHSITAYEPFNYISSYQPLKPLPKQKNKFSIISYPEKYEKMTPYNKSALSLKAMKTYLIDKHKKLKNVDTSWLKSQIELIKSYTKLDEMMGFSMPYIYLRITFFKNGKQIKQQIVVFEYYYGC